MLAKIRVPVVCAILMMIMHCEASEGRRLTSGRSPSRCTKGLCKVKQNSKNPK